MRPSGACHNPYVHVVFPQRGGSTWRRLAVPPPAVAAEGEGTGGGDLSDEQSAFLRLVFSAASLDLQCYRAETLRRRLPACLRALRVPTLYQARRLVERDASQGLVAVGAILLGVTRFFRDEGVFRVLQERVIPQMAAERGYVRGWSVGCSDGSELYSLAMLLAQVNMLGRAYLVGTDCRRDAIAAAKRGWYEAESVAGLPAELRERYFRFQSDAGSGASGFRVHPWLQAAAHFWVEDALSRKNAVGAWDVVMCRNVAIYLTASAAARLWRVLEGSVRPGGVLVLGKAERPLAPQQFEMISPCIYRRVRGER